MTTEEKAKAYDEALEKAKKYHEEYWQVDAKDITETLFPQLRESEDEGIRRKMIEHFKSKTKETWCNMPVKDILAWLEKQKELSELGKYIADKRSEVGFYCNHKEVSWNEIPFKDRKHDYPYYFDGDIDCYPFVVRKQKEQKFLKGFVTEEQTS